MKLDLNKPVSNLNFEPIPNSNLAKILAEEIAVSNVTPTIKFFDWALSLHQKGEINVDATDRDLLRKFIEENQRFTVLVKAQLLKAVNDLKE